MPRHPGTRRHELVPGHSPTRVPKPYRLCSRVIQSAGIAKRLRAANLEEAPVFTAFHVKLALIAKNE